MKEDADFSFFPNVIKELDIMIQKVPNAEKVLQKIKEECAEVMKLDFFKKMLSVGYEPEGHKIEESDFLTNTNESTRMIIEATALLAALGAYKIKDLKMDPVNGDTKYLLGREGKSEALQKVVDDYYQEIKRNIRKAIPVIEKIILDARKNFAGAMPVGGKIHTQEPMSVTFLNQLQNLFNLGKTPFRLIHANDSLLLPPMVTGQELSWLVAILEQFGILNGKSPDLQTAMAGRWSEENASVVGASMILATNSGVKYAKGAFSTTHDSETGAHIMAYDAGVKNTDLPFDLSNAKGRTDMLGRHDFDDTKLYQILGTGASHLEFGGMYAPAMEKYIQKFRALLEKNELLPHLNEAAWIFNHADKDDPEATRKHEDMVEIFTDAWHKGSLQLNYGIIGEVRQLISELYHDMQEISARTISPEHLEYKKLMTF